MTDNQNNPQNQDWRRAKMPAPQQNNQATTAMVLSIFGILSLFCCSIYVSLMLGVLSSILAVLSRRDQNFSTPAVAALTLGIISVVGSLAMFALVLRVYQLLDSPVDGPILNEAARKVIDFYDNLLTK